MLLSFQEIVSTLCAHEREFWYVKLYFLTCSVNSCRIHTICCATGKRGGHSTGSCSFSASGMTWSWNTSISALHRANLCKAPITRFPFTEIFVTCCCVSSDDNWAVFYSVAGMRKGWWSRHLNKQKNVLVAVHGIYRSEQQVRISVINYFVLLIHEQNLSGSLSRLLQLTSIWRLSLLSAAFEQIFAESCARSWWYTDDSFCFSEFLKCTSF